MKINEMIRELRIKKGFTQEQLASLLGVSAPAVNKWEKAASYPGHYAAACAGPCIRYGFKHTAFF